MVGWVGVGLWGLGVRGEGVKREEEAAGCYRVSLTGGRCGGDDLVGQVVVQTCLYLRKVLVFFFLKQLCNIFLISLKPVTGRCTD